MMLTGLPVPDEAKSASDVDGYRVDFISKEPMVYLGLHYGQTDVVKLVSQCSHVDREVP